MFRHRESSELPSPGDLLESLIRTVQSGGLPPGESFPNATQLATLTGANPCESLAAVTRLLKSGVVRQHDTGQLVVNRVLSRNDA